MTVCGLSTVNLSTITAVQQVILFFLMVIGDITIVSWVMALVRKHYFRTRCEYIVASRPKHRTRTIFVKSLIDTSKQAVSHFRTHGDPKGDGATDQPTVLSPILEESPALSVPKPERPRIDIRHPTPGATLVEDEAPNATTHMIGSLLLSDQHSGVPVHSTENVSSTGTGGKVGGSAGGNDNAKEGHGDSWLERRSVKDSGGDVKTVSSSPKAISVQIESPKPLSIRIESPRPMSIAIESPKPLSMMEPMSPSRAGHVAFAMSTGVDPYRRNGVPLARRRATFLSQTAARTNPSDGPDATTSRKYEDFGGFPGIAQLAAGALKVTAPHTYRKIQRKASVMVPAKIEAEKTSWLNFDMLTGRNSDFHTDELSDEELEDIGGVEYRALRLLSYLVPLYFVGTQVIAFLLFGPWISVTSQYDPVFDAQPRVIKKPWFALFQVLAAYTGGGMSLVDAGMLPFQSAYLMIFGMIFVILAGNHALPIFLRFVIWIGWKLSPKGSEAESTFSFLLEHPRRCFLYLFPSHQTWFLLIALVGFSAVEWAAFEVLNIGIDVFDSMAQGPKIVAGLFQGLAARASGFSIVPLASMSPALQFLYVVMMYIAVYPVAMSIRSTNVYEERSLGVFEEPDEDVEEEPEDGELKKLGRRERIGRYLNWHVRKQLSVDIWWLVWAVFFIAIIERRNILDEEKKWFDMFRVLFELVSAFGGIGLSLGFPSDNYSFVGAMRPLSKLIVIVIMVRGRHRGLPVAVDRAVLLPHELVTKRHAPQSQQNKEAEIAHAV
ncbi:hypothetical protein AX16_006617 [Volvariella volvacea WC 439]|nr:hypothetical protein AX16_006617 [Volvariella volvacea WC 439]